MQTPGFKARLDNCLWKPLATRSGAAYFNGLIFRLRKLFSIQQLLASHLLLVTLWWGVTASGAGTNSSPPLTFTNPVITSGADPWVLRWNDHYYLSQSRRGAIWVNRFQNLSEIATNQWTKVWTAPTNTPYSRNIWAPELHRIGNEWFIYFAADDGTNANHRMYVLQGTSQNPQEAFNFKGRIAAPTDRWAIDGTVLKMPGGKLYFVWSGWEGFEDGAQNLYIAPMSDPRTISSERVLISQPEHPWEQHGWPDVNEGPEPLWNGTNLFLIYSASGSWTDHYCLGQLTWTGGDLLDANSWVKKPTPVFAATDSVFGPGHCSFVKSRDGREDWIIYHSAQSKGSGWRRQINMQPFTWNRDGSPNFGKPFEPDIRLPYPSGDAVGPVVSKKTAELDVSVP